MLRRNIFRLAIGALSLTALLHAAPSRADCRCGDAGQQGRRPQSLLKQAADVNAAQGDGMTALHWAAMKNDSDLAQTLLYAGANVRATTRIGAYTPLLLAAKNGSAAVLAPLLKAGADVNGATANGTTPLMFAAASGSVDAVAVLIDAGANVNAKDSVRGLTPAMFAAASDRADVLTLLAKKGADLKATSKVTDLAALSRDPAALRAFTHRQPAAADRAVRGRGGRRRGPAGLHPRRPQAPHRPAVDGVHRRLAWIATIS